MKIEIELDDDFNEDGFDKVLLSAAVSIQQVMKAGHIARAQAGKPTNEWKAISSKNRFNHAFVHLLNCKTHEGNGHEPCSALTKDTALLEIEHSLTGLAMCLAIEGGYMNFESETEFVVDTTEDQLKGE